MTSQALADDLEELSSAEDFLIHFGVTYDPGIVHVNRLHIMQRFHDYLQKGSALIEQADNDSAVFSIYRQLLERAYQDFVESDAQTEKVFKVFHMHEPQTGFVPLEQLLES